MDEEKLIEFVQRYQLLYDLSHPKYMDNVKKDVIWKEISDQLKQPVAACKQRWQSLRDAFRRALNKRKTKSGLTGNKAKKWKYEDEMSFVIPYFVERKKSNAVDNFSDEDDNKNKESATLRSDNTENDCGSENADFETSIVNIDSCNPNQAQENRKRRYSPCESQNSANAVLIEQILQERIERGNDELDTFFQSISSTIKKFTPYMQALAKNKIFSLVSEMELQQLAPSMFATSHHSSTGTPLLSTRSIAEDSNIPIPDSPNTSSVKKEID